MKAPVLLLWEDTHAQRWAPFSLTRPVSELLLGQHSLRKRIQDFWGVDCVATLGPDHLADFREDDSPPVLGVQDAARWDAFPRIIFLSRGVPSGSPPPLPTHSTPLEIADERVGWYLAPGDPLPSQLTATLGELAATPGKQAATLRITGEVMDGPWRLMARSSEYLARDLAVPGAGWTTLEPGSRPGVSVIGPHPVWLGHGVELDPGVLLDTRKGPVALGDSVWVKGLSRLEGPLFVGPESQVLGGSLSALSAGPQCRLQGEISHCIILGYANKAHDGHLGHAMVGRWVNLGAFTSNSDLKNNYGAVRVPTPHGWVETGLLKVGCFLGDHVRTGIGTLLNTGTVVGAGSNLFGGVMPPTLVPPFSWGSGADLVEFRLDAFLDVARTAMSRRGVTLDPAGASYLQAVWNEGRRQAAGSVPPQSAE
ncbi:MAG: putative sugar nucleotidyl transferase [Gemmatimonadota bacterium]